MRLTDRGWVVLTAAIVGVPMLVGLLSHWTWY